MSQDDDEVDGLRLVQKLPPSPRLRGLGPPALRAFFRIAGAWSLDDQEQMCVLGISKIVLLRAWRGGGLTGFNAETLERISLVIGIFKAINTMLPNAGRAHAWMRKSNKAPLLRGQSAVAFIVQGNLNDLRALRTYLDAEVGDD